MSSKGTVGTHHPNLPVITDVEEIVEVIWSAQIIVIPFLPQTDLLETLIKESVIVCHRQLQVQWQQGVVIIWTITMTILDVLTEIAIETTVTTEWENETTSTGAAAAVIEQIINLIIAEDTITIHKKVLARQITKQKMADPQEGILTTMIGIAFLML